MIPYLGTLVGTLICHLLLLLVLFTFMFGPTSQAESVGYSFAKPVCVEKAFTTSDLARSSEGGDNSSRLRKIKAQSMHNIGYLQTPSNNGWISSEESLGLLMDTHFPGSSENHMMEYTLRGGVEKDDIPAYIVSSINVYWAISSFEHMVLRRVPRFSELWALND